jgi:hypothetical protein
MFIVEVLLPMLSVSLNAVLDTAVGDSGGHFGCNCCVTKSVVKNMCEFDPEVLTRVEGRQEEEFLGLFEGKKSSRI